MLLQNEKDYLITHDISRSTDMVCSASCNEIVKMHVCYHKLLKNSGKFIEGEAVFIG